MSSPAHQKTALSAFQKRADLSIINSGLRAAIPSFGSNLQGRYVTKETGSIAEGAKHEALASGASYVGSIPGIINTFKTLSEVEPRLNVNLFNSRDEYINAFNKRLSKLPFSESIQQFSDDKQIPQKIDDFIYKRLGINIHRGPFTNPEMLDMPDGSRVPRRTIRGKVKLPPNFFKRLGGGGVYTLLGSAALSGLLSAALASQANRHYNLD